MRVMDAFAEARCWRLNPSSAPNPNEFVQRSKSFAATLGSSGYATLLVRRVGQSIESYVMSNGIGSPDQAVLHLAHSVGAQVAEVDEFPQLNAGVVAVLAARRGAPGRDSQYGASPTAVADRLKVSLGDGQWVAIALRQSTRHEQRQTREWYRHMLRTNAPTHHAFEEGAVVMALTVGGRIGDDLETLGKSVVASLPGFDVPHRFTTVSAQNLQKGALAASVPAWAAGFAWGHGLPIALAASTPFALASVWFSAARERRLAACEQAHFKSPSKLRWFSRFRKQKSDSAEPPYPLPVGSFLVGPAVCPGLVAPHAGASSGAKSTAAMAAPEALSGPIGPIVGTAGDDNSPVSLSMADAWSGVGICGQPGSGKSQLARSLFAYSLNDFVRPTGRAGHMGGSQSIIVFESKADGLRDLLAWCDVIGVRPAVFDVGDPRSMAFDLLAGPGTIRSRVERFVGAMVYAFDDGSIQAQSQATLTTALCAALLVSDEVCQQAGEKPGMSPVELATVLLAGSGDERGTRLAAAIMDLVKPSSITGEALDLLQSLYGPKVTPSQRKDLTQAPRNKMQRLMAANSWWASGRRKVTVDEMLSVNGVTIVYTGPSAAPGADMLDEITTSALMAMTAYLLRDSIARMCSGWRDIGRAVTVFADELSLLAKTSPEVITWLRDQGRSYGVRLVFATQRPEQLAAPVRDAFLGFGTFVWFAQANTAVVAAAAADLSAGGDVWGPDAVVNLPAYRALLRATAGQQRQPVVPISVTFFEKDRSTFLKKQGLAP